MLRIKKRDLRIIASLRKDARQRLTTISRNLGIPVSTIYDRIKQHDAGLVIKHTALIDFNQLGFVTRAFIALKSTREKRGYIRELLEKNPYINSLHKINNGYDFFVEAVFCSLSDLEKFLDSIEKYTVQKQVYYCIEELGRETFLDDPKKIESLKEFEK